MNEMIQFAATGWWEIFVTLVVIGWTAFCAGLALTAVQPLVTFNRLDTKG